MYEKVTSKLNVHTLAFSIIIHSFALNRINYSKFSLCFVAMFYKGRRKIPSGRFRLLEEPSSLGTHHRFLLFTIVAIITLSMSVLAYWYNLLLLEKMMRAISQSHRMDNSYAFFITPNFRLLNVTWDCLYQSNFLPSSSSPTPLPSPPYCIYHRCHHDHNHHNCYDLKSFIQPVYSSRR